ncbi:BTB/POZ and MATH domain-containing protein 1, partial [Dichanthelium oligosanthes]
MSSTAVGGNLARSASAIIATASIGYHVLKIDGYSRLKGMPTGEFIRSHPFTIGDHRWCIRYYPNGDDSESTGYISLFLFLSESVTKAVKAQYKFRFIDDVEEQTLLLTSEPVYNFESTRGWGRARFVKTEDLENSKHLKDDSFVVRCDISITNECHVEEIAEVPTTTVPSVPQSDLHQQLGNLLQSEKGADVMFEVSSEKFKAH